MTYFQRCWSWTLSRRTPKWSPVPCSCPWQPGPAGPVLWSLTRKSCIHVLEHSQDELDHTRRVDDDSRNFLVQSVVIPSATSIAWWRDPCAELKDRSVVNLIFCACRFGGGGGGGTQDATLLCVWWHGQHGKSDGKHWWRYVILITVASADS